MRQGKDTFESYQGRSELQFSNYFNMQEMQEIQDAFASATGVAAVITDVTGNPITQVSPCGNLCKRLCFNTSSLAGCISFEDVMDISKPIGLQLKPCFISGLWVAVEQIIVADQHVGNWLVGPVLAADVQKDHGPCYGQEIGDYSQELRLALTAVIHMPLEQFNKIVQAFFLTVNQLSKLVTENIKKNKEIQQLHRGKSLQTALYKISETVSTSRNLEELYKSVHAVIDTLIPAKNIYIAIMDEGTGMLHFPYRVDECDGNPGSRKLTNGLAEYLIRIGQPMLIDPQLRDELEARGDAKTIGTRAKDWLGVPLKTADNKTFGVMAVFTFVERVRYSSEDQEIISFVSNQVAMAIERKQAEETLHYIGLHDTLTGLYNRTYFEKKLIQYDEEYPLPISIFICDINGLKFVNDTFGHVVGDQLLVLAAELLTSVIRQGDIVARIGGDEFAILLPQTDQHIVHALVRKVRSLLVKQKAESGGVPLSLSFGYAVKKNNADSLQDILKEADNAMCREKLHHSQSGRSAIVQTVMKLLEERDFHTEEHAIRLEQLTTRIACKLELPETKVADIQLLAQFHDIGKVGIADHILLKPGLLTASEKKEMQRHSEIGYRIALSHVDLAPIADWVLKHHEWWNGKGYPFGLGEGNIPLECRILAIADAYDAMTSHRPYRAALSHEFAIAELKRFAGIQFDPEIVEIFVGTFCGENK